MRWNSPVPYVFLGMGVVLSMIAVALIVLVCCSHRKSEEEEEEEEEEKYASSSKGVERVTEVEPRILVIMAGEKRPTCLAKPSHIIIVSPPN
ncbi:hypothetical protein H6P81_008618 [Aristolochia fimbriata]|uniref:Uncharacterized protein n=1 Tax=Aristolochia fimbriata TaxID=158543 RepID=A0AAV7EN48_ARIFI|nr:hypothetical protein H6P81_008618 [Aristolochia fimbriata]